MDLFEGITGAECETSRLLQEVEGLQNRASENWKIDGLLSVNAKLKYQIKHLNESIAREESNGMKYTTNILRVVNGVFSHAIRSLYPGVPELKAAVQYSGSKFGDYKCMAAMPLAQMLKAQGCPKSPRDIAQEIVAGLRLSDTFIEKCEVAGPGFINISLKPSYVSQMVSKLLVGGVKPPPISQVRRVIVDFSSPNIAKEMHVGHLRSTIIGETICRLLEFAGHDVLRLNHVGDWGTQFGMLVAHLFDKFPDYQKVSPPIGDLQTFYKILYMATRLWKPGDLAEFNWSRSPESKKRFDDDEDFKKRAYSCVVRLQNYDSEVIDAWKLICDVSRREFEHLYERLGIQLTERGESFYQSMMLDVVQDLETKGLVRQEDGRKVVFAKGLDVPLTIQKSDGAYTYDTSDLAALRHRVQEEKGNWLIYVVDAGQALHFQTVFAIGCEAGYYCPQHVRVDHVEFGVVLGEDKKKFKSRSGDTVRLVDLLDEGLERAHQKLMEKDRPVVLSDDEMMVAERNVAYGCIKYADLSHTRTNNYIFSFNKMLNDKGNTAVYLLYAYTRIRSIARLADVTAVQLKEAALTTVIDVTHEKELKLAKCIIRFPEVISRIMDDLYPHVLCEYLYELCTTFSEFYDVCYCVEKDRVTGQIVKVNMSRLLLCEATAIVLDKSFHIVGLDPLLKM